MRNTFLLLVCMVMFLLIKKAPDSGIKRIHVNQSQRLVTSGTLLLPMNISVRNDSVNTGTLFISVAGKIYRYARRYEGMYSSDMERSIKVIAGDEIASSVPVKLILIEDM